MTASETKSNLFAFVVFTTIGMNYALYTSGGYGMNHAVKYCLVTLANNISQKQSIEYICFSECIWSNIGQNRLS